MIKVDKLRVNNFRGIKRFEFELRERNFVVAGRNGTGKSGVIDALEFAFTGSVGRLTGRGTAGVSVKSHAPHVDFATKPKTSWVEVDFVIQSSGARHTMRRDVASPRELTLIPESVEARTAVAWMQKHPEFALTRREIVRFVLAEGKSRADDVAELLGLERIGLMRSLLQKISNADKRDDDRERQLLASREADLKLAARTTSIDDPAVLARLNNLRAALGLQPTLTVGASEALAGLEVEQEGATLSANRAVWLQRLDMAAAGLAAAIELDLAKTLKMLLNAANVHCESARFTVAIDSDDLLTSALALFDGQLCPVCDTKWICADFVEIVSHKKREADEARAILTRFAIDAAANAEALRDLYQALKLADQVESEMAQGTAAPTPIADELERVRALGASVKSITSLDDLISFAEKANCDPLGAQTTLMALRSRVAALPEPSESDRVRGELRATAQAIRELHSQQQATYSTSAKADLSTKAFTAFSTSTTESLLAIYQTVQKTFAKFYAAINADDESEFTATLTPSGSGLDMQVAFFDRGLFPPGAYHSEGHQDAMGLCLYLALASHTLGANFSLSALDDVLMSVDAGHRRYVVSLLAQEFPNTQFVITTHDDQWMRQMKTQGLARSAEILQFRSWDVDRGPVSWRNYEPWAEIDSFVSANDTKPAAGLLRSYLEYFSREAADALRSPVPFRLDGRNTLGELFDSSVKSLRDAIKKGKAAANSWNQQDLVDSLSAWDSAILRASLQAKLEEWAINTVVHFNEWENLSGSELKFVVDAWKDLLSKFECPSCSGLLRIVMSEEGLESLKCDCGITTVNLILKTA